MRSPATTSWTWRPLPMFVSALTSRSTPLWRSVCSTRSRPRRQSPERRSRHRNGRHLCLPGLRRLRCRSPAPAPSTVPLISRRDPAGLGPRVATGDRALDELAGETAGPLRQFLLLGWRRVADTARVPMQCWPHGTRSRLGQASGRVGGRRIWPVTIARSAQTTRLLATAVGYETSDAPSSAEVPPCPAPLRAPAQARRTMRADRGAARSVHLKSSQLV
jgi:hypothetical protein